MFYNIFSEKVSDTYRAITRGGYASRADVEGDRAGLRAAWAVALPQTRSAVAAALPYGTSAEGSASS
jgi:hypothetical protein